METKHTKGEWIDGIESACQFERTIKTDSGIRICEVKSYYGEGFNDPTTEEAEANAKLIVAAPELLQMLIKISEIESSAFCLSGFDVVRLKSEINKAIEKATK